MKKILESVLKSLAQAIIKKYQPKVIGITGSVGKTSAREAVFAVLSRKFSVRRSEKNYNNEVGLPLAIIGAPAAGKSLLGWIRVFLHAFRQILINDKDFPKILVLEMGVDHPGDMEYLLSIVSCDIGIETTIGQSHMEFFGDEKSIQEEKGKLIRQLPISGHAILNHDNQYTRQMSDWGIAPVITYGLSSEATIHAENVQWSYDEDSGSGGVRFDLMIADNKVSVSLDHSFGQAVVYAALAGAAAGIAMDMSLEEISAALRDFVPAKGRMNIIAGLNKSILIDDTYNASPQSTESALNALSALAKAKNGTTWAVLGDMLELGRETEAKHREIGELAAKLKIDKLVSVGNLSKNIAMGAKTAGMAAEDIIMVETAVEAGSLLREKIGGNDIILAKGSQGMRMEKCLELIINPQILAKDVLVRQGREWKG